MGFATPTFAVFLAVILVAFWSAGTARARNVLLIAANYVFCGWMDVRFAVVLALVAATSFAGARWIHAAGSGRARRARLVACLTLLAGALVTLKYGASLAGALGGGPGRAAAMLFAPVGLSYYVLQTAGYCIDVCRGRAPERDAITYFAYVGFFPALVAGPIASASAVLPQFAAPRAYRPADAQAGARQIVWGLYKKLVVADALARTVDYVFARHAELPASALAIGLAMYSFQIYADFSGYSDIAIGLGRLFGIELPRNFETPYFSRSVAEFWRRWHMSLSAWLRAYAYLPLGGRGSGRLTHARNILIVFAVSGLWHNMTWNFLAWGVVNGLFFLPVILWGTVSGGKVQRNAGARWRLADVAGVCATFGLISLSRVFFRAPDMPTALAYYRALFDTSLFAAPEINLAVLSPVALLLAVEWVQRFGMPAMLRRANVASLRYPVYAVVVYLVAVGLARPEAREFLYARF